MKKLFSVLLVVALLFTAFAMPAAAEERGEEVTVSFSISENTGFANFRAELTYDEDALELKSFTAGDMISGGMPSANVAQKTFGWMATTDVTANGVLFYATFLIKDTAAAGTYPINVAITSCSNAAAEKITMNVSGASVTVTIPPCDVHTYGEYTGTEPTCTEAGVKTATCTVCGYVDTKTTPATGHNFGAWEMADASNHTRACADCDVTETKPHGWKLTETVDATCAEDGQKTFTCTECAATKTEVIEATGDHVYTGWTEVDADKHEGTCGCGETITQNHKWNDGKVTTEATCANDGVKTYTCVDCGATKTEAIKATGAHVYTNWTKVDADKHEGTCGCGATITKDHNWDAGKVTTEATCGTDGAKTYTCGDCKATKVEVIAATGEHDYTVSYKDNGDNTHTALCACEEGKVEDHSFTVQGEVIQRPTTSTEGKQEMLCICGAKSVRTLSKLPVDSELDDVPQTGDLSVYYTMNAASVAAVMSAAGAVLYGFKRKASK